MQEDIFTEMKLLRDLAADEEQMYRAATIPQLGRIAEVLRRVMGERVPRLVRVRAVGLLLGYEPERFLTTEQLSLKSAGAFITWAFILHKPDADLDTVPIRESAGAVIEWAIRQAQAETSEAELRADEERQRAEQRQRSRERYARKKREAASLRPQGEPALS